MAQNTNSQDLQALKDFLLDIKCLEPLSEWTKKFNLFDILKISRTEIRHSNVLSWLMTPNDGHCLGDKVLRGFVQYSVENSDDVDVFKILLMDFNSFVLLREWKSIDILAISEKEKFALCIENKVDSSEHDEQLERYKSILEREYPDYKKLYIYLTKDGEDSSDSENWLTMSYKNVLDIVESAKLGVELPTDVEMFIENYVETLRRYIVQDEKLIKICSEIYAKHQRALDLIFENVTDKTAKLMEAVRSWAVQKAADGKISFDSEYIAKTLARFSTKDMTGVIKDSTTPTSYWKSNRFYYYGIFITKSDNNLRLHASLVVSLVNMSPDNSATFEKMTQIIKKSPKGGQQTFTVLKTSYQTVDASKALSENEVFDKLDAILAELLEKEKKLIEKLNVK